MVIDIHCHLWRREYLPEPWWGGQAELLAEWNTRRGKPVTAREIEERVYPEFWDPTGERTLERMAEAGIEKTVLLALDFGWVMTEAAIPIEEQNQELARVIKKYPDRLIGFFGIDPRRKGAAKLFERAVQEWGMKGLKLHTASAFYPDDPEVYPLLERASQWNLPVLVHTGYLPSPVKSEYAHPSHLDKILADFPNLTIIAAHLSWGWWRELIELGKVRPNLMCDFSAHQLTIGTNYGQFCHILRKVIDGFGIGRVLFGTDSPMTDPFISRKEWVDCIRNLPSRSPEGIPFGEEEVSALLEGNAKRVLGLS